MENKIDLKFDKMTTRLAGNPYGKSVYKEQVKDKIDFSKINIICFPENIEKIASSFTQGFFTEIINEIGFNGIDTKIKLITKKKELEEEVLRDLFS
jgi:hypothetical protein